MNQTERRNRELFDEARALDAADPLAGFRDEFHIPRRPDGEEEIYFVGNSLGLQPKRTEQYVQEELEKWRRLAVRGHFESEYPWMPYHEFLTPAMAELVGAESEEVVVMNSLTTNLHLMMASFYRPTPQRYKILIEEHAFPSDHYAVESQLKWHGFDPDRGLALARPVSSSPLVDHDELETMIRTHAAELALVLLPGVQYYTGQAFDIPRIAAVTRELEIPFGVDLAHAAGNLELALHDWGVDFAVWCSYKYLNSGPGSVGGCFVHRRHVTNMQIPRLAGWWGHDKETRFEMKNDFRPIPTAEGWQLSNPPILSLAAVRASLDVFVAAGGMRPLREKSHKLTGFLESQLQRWFADEIRLVTPCDPEQRGCQLSLEINFPHRSGREIHTALESRGVRVDWREPSAIRVAPVPLYNSFLDVARFVATLDSLR